MTYLGTVSTVTGKLYRVNVSGNISAPIGRLTNAFRETVDSQGATVEDPPKVGEKVLCWFPGEALCDGCILGILEA